MAQNSTEKFTTVAQLMDEKAALDRTCAKVAKSMMEPDAQGFDLEPAAMASIAISLKRIADFLCGGKDHEGIDRMDVVAYLGREFGEWWK